MLLCIRKNSTCKGKFHVGVKNVVRNIRISIEKESKLTFYKCFLIMGKSKQIFQVLIFN